MALPLILLIGAGAAGGFGTGVHGAVKMNHAGELMEETNAQHERNIERFRLQNVEICGIMDTLGRLELDVLKSFGEFSKIFEKLRDRPEFRYNDDAGVSLPEFNPKEIKRVSLGAVVLLNVLSGGAAGAAGGFAAAGVASAAVTAFGTASTGTAIASLSGQAAINATLATLGGGSLAAGGGGMALGSLVLNLSTLGVGLLIGGIIFSVSGSSLSKKADEAWEQVQIEEASVNKICGYLKDLSKSGKKYLDALSKVREIYMKQLRELRHTVNVLQKTNCRNFTEKETLNLQNTILLVGLLYEMCKVKLVLKNENEDDINTVNHIDVEDSIVKSEKMIGKLISSNDVHNYIRKDENDARINRIMSEADAKLDAYKWGE